MKKKIYAKEGSSIKTILITINQTQLQNILKKLDNYYGVKVQHKTTYYDFMSSYKKDNKVKTITDIDIVNYLDSSGFNQYLYKIKYDEFIPVGLSKIIRDIIYSNNKIKNSYYVADLIDYVSDYDESILKSELLNCMSFEILDKKIGFNKILFNYELKKEINNKKSDYIDCESGKNLTEKLPNIKVLNSEY